MEEDKKHLEFMNSIKKYDADVPSEGAETNPDLSTSVMDTSKDTMAELFQDEGGEGGGMRHDVSARFRIQRRVKRCVGDSIVQQQLQQHHHQH